MGSQRSSLACILIFILPSVICDQCWIARTGQTEWCNGYCCDTPINGWGCCCDDGDDVQTIVLGLSAILLWTMGVTLCIAKAILCYLGGDIYVYVHRKIKRRIAKWRRRKEELYLRQLAEKNVLRHLLKENVSGTHNSEEWRKIAKLYGMQEDGNEEMGHELSCLCCDKFRISLGQV